ncbi:MAG: purine-nucleoside phosphorylase [Bacteroidota bacterium]
MIQRINEAVEYLRGQGIDAPEVGVILGTGLGSGFTAQMNIDLTIRYSDIPHFPAATVEFHSGQLHYGTIGRKRVLAMQGRFHYYEGYDMQEVTFPVRVLKLLGIKSLLISNAAGNINLDWNKGDLMLLDDHINLQPDNPLRGKNLDDLGSRFPDMSAPYDPSMNKMLIEIAEENNVTLRSGVYAAVTGPNLETRAEYRYLQIIGADAVGMSTVPEVIVANHMGLPCCAISVLTDDCDPDNLEPVNIEEIIAIAGQAEAKLTELYIKLIGKM